MTAPSAPAPPDGGRVACEDCGATFPARYFYEPSLPPHRCAERQARRNQEPFR